MFKHFVRLVVVSTSLLLFQQIALAAPSVSDVYRAAESGHVRDALTMMDQVLSEHPNSGQAHYVEADLLAKAGQYDQARRELDKARQLNPGLSFAKPAAVAALQAQLYPANGVQSYGASQNRGISLMPFVVVGLLVLSVVLFIRSRQRTMQNVAYNSMPPAGYGPGYGPGYPPPSGGLGSSILGGLATGAAVGAGMVAGEALANRLMDGHEDHLSSGDVHPDVNQDMGGDNFGLTDSSWDSGSSGDFGGDMGGGDWS